MNKEQAVSYLRFSGFSDEQIKTIEGAFACEDAISRQAVIDEISKARDINLGILPTGHRSYEDILRCVAMAYDMGKDHALNVLRSMPSVNPQKPICPSAGVDCEDCPAYEPKTRWIPVSERLPEIHQDVLLSFRSLDIEVGFRGNTEPYYYCHGVYIVPQNVLAWQPLPEPYKAEGSGE